MSRTGFEIIFLIALFIIINMMFIINYTIELIIVGLILFLVIKSLIKKFGPKVLIFAAVIAAIIYFIL